MENACSASSKLDSKGRGLCLDVSSVQPQCNKEQEPNPEDGIKPEGVDICKGEDELSNLLHVTWNIYLTNYILKI